MIRFAMIGGFLGSGKTTAILRLAQRHSAAGRRVGIIANDIGRGLVDTQTYRAHGLAVEEMSGVCFACRFDELLAAAGRLQDGHHPDVLLAEPAGSCTDIVSRVVEPLRTLYGGRFRVAPYVTLLDPQRAHTALTGTGPAGFSAKVTYLYKMQQNEADIVAVNKADILTASQKEETMSLVVRNFPKAQAMMVSARTGEGFEPLARLLDADEPAGRNPIATDVLSAGAFAEGDARLSWLDGTWQITAAVPFDADGLLLDLAGAIQEELVAVGAEPAHIKMTMHSGSVLGTANVVSSDRAPELSKPAVARLTDGTLSINARVEADAAVLRREVEQAVCRTAEESNVEIVALSIREMVPEISGTVCDTLQPGGAGVGVEHGYS